MTNNFTMEQQENSLIVNAQYIKDLSFENPKAPASFMSKSEPKIGVSIDVNASALGSDLFEVSLRIHIDGKVSESSKKVEKVEGGELTGTLFVLDLEYTGLFTIERSNEEEKEVILLVHCPALLFPYARQIVSDMMRNGGYPPLMLSPFDFMGLYNERKNEIERNKASD